MIRTKILGMGSYVPDRVVTNEEIAFLDDQHVRQAERQMDTSDEWIQQRTGIRERRYVPPQSGLASSDLAVLAAKRALESAGMEATEIDCIILGTLSPDIHFPGTAVFVQEKLGLVAAERYTACYDIRQQCSAFIYGLEMADALIRTGRYERILLVGTELHSHSLDYSTRGRDVAVLFGDAAGAFILGPTETDDPDEGIIYTQCAADGSGAKHLYLTVFEIARLPYVWYDARDREENIVKYPQMNGKAVFTHAVRRMTEATVGALKRTGKTWDDIDWFVPHQANLRINQKVAELAQIPPEKVLNTIEFYGNTTAATIPLTIDHWRQQGRVKPGDTFVAAVFGSGFTWGASVFRW